MSDLSRSVEFSVESGRVVLAPPLAAAPLAEPEHFLSQVSRVLDPDPRRLCAGAIDVVISLTRPSDYQDSHGARFVVRFKKARSFHGDDVQDLEAALERDGTGARSWT